jgi:flagellar motor switch protein FliM
MSDEVLSQAEVESLLDAMETGRSERVPGAAAGVREACAGPAKR